MTTRTTTARMLGAAVSCLLIGGVAACGTSASDAGEDSSRSTLPDAEGTTQYPLEIDTWLGSSTLEERPTRVAVFGYSSSLDSLEALGVTPVYYGGRDAEAGWDWNDPAYLDSIETTDVVEDFMPRPEAILAADPDLIITNGILTDTEQYERLSAIAPVLDVPADPGDGDQADWRAEQLAVGEALDLADAAQTAIDEAEDRVTTIKDEHPEFAGRTATIAFDYGAEFGLDYYTVTGGPAEGLLLDLGFSPNPLAEEFVAEAGVSDENQAKLAADALVMIYNTESGRESREAQGLFAAIPAVQDERYESLVYPENAEANAPLTTSDGEDAQNAVWVLRRGASAVALPWAAEIVADQWFGDIDLS